MAVFVNVGGVWKNVTNTYVNVGGAWKTVSSTASRISGVWKSFSKTLVAPSYANPGGTGNRSSLITVSTSWTIGYGTPSRWVNGDYSSPTAYFGGNMAVAGKYVMFLFNEPKQITETKWYQEGTKTDGVWKWQGYNSLTGDGWNDIGGSFTLGGNLTNYGGVVYYDTHTSLSSNVKVYNYYRMIGVSGSTADGHYMYQMDFKLSKYI